jgi:hypothetical protein
MEGGITLVELLTPHTPRVMPISVSVGVALVCRVSARAGQDPLNLGGMVV